MPSIPRRWLFTAVALAASLPYLTTIPDYFVQDDFGVVNEPRQAALVHVSSLVHDHMAGERLGEYS